ncbi:MAG: DUF4070 domain-containing protein [Opitutaceae bacterium]|nr:DUF4070 domain-containing protein [Opitutaceae bacterium]
MKILLVSPKTPNTRAGNPCIKSFWVPGVWHRGRWAYWRFCLRTLFMGRRRFRAGPELAILGHHFRRVAATL